MRVLRYSCGVLCGIVGLFLPITHASAFFRDVPKTHPQFEAINTLVDAGVITGYSDGTFRPDALVKRSEALTLLLRSAFDAKYIDAFRAGPSGFRDVATEEWYNPFVVIATQQGVIDGPPTTPAFSPERPVVMAEFLKMLLILHRHNTLQFAAEKKPIALDVNPTDWHYRYIAAACSRTLILPRANGSMMPGEHLTRARIAELLYTYQQFSAGNRKEFSTERIFHEVQWSMAALRSGDEEKAIRASFRSIVLVEGLLEKHPDDKEFLAIRTMTWAAGKLIKGDAQTAEKLLNEGNTLSPEVFNRYVSLFTQ